MRLISSVFDGVLSSKSMNFWYSTTDLYNLNSFLASLMFSKI